MPIHLYRFAAGLVATFLILAVVAPAWSQEDPAVAEADRLFQAKEWDKAAAAYKAILARDDSNARAWYRWAAANHSLKQYTESAEGFARAAELGFAPFLNYYNLACAYARLGKKEDAMASLQKAVDAGFQNAAGMEEDEDLAPLRGESEFADLLEQARINQDPCNLLPEYRQFDFWVGEWDVFNPQGEKVGENRITKLPGGCALLEQWQGTQGNPGQSLNYYDHTTGEWVQIWVASTGMLPARGHVTEDGAMRMTGRHLLRNGQVQLYRGTWTPLDDGRVRQYLEKSNDWGKTWYLWFDGYYVRRSTN